MATTVDGIFEHNKKIRDNMLKYNIGKYSQWPFSLNPAIGEYYNIDYNRQLKDLTNGKGLLAFTHDGKSEYSEEIKRKFFSSKEEEPYFVRPLTYGELNPWVSFQNGGYIQYIDEVFGKDDVMRHVDYVNNLLSGQFIENALRQTEVGVIKDINVGVALQGVVTTNPNNMSGEDTTLGKIGNRMYAQTLYNGAIFNSDRMKAKIHDGENYYQKSYLTPSLINQYGNNLANVYELSDIMKIGTNETHIREDLGADVHILDGYTENNFANLTLPEFRILNEQINNALNIRGVQRSILGGTPPSSIEVGNASTGSVTYRDTKGNDLLLPIRVYTPVDGEGYVNAHRKITDWRYDDLGIDTTEYRFTNPQDVETPVTSQEKGARLFGPYAVGIYTEADIVSYNDNTSTKKLTNEIRSDELNLEENQFNTYDDISENGNDLLSKTSRLFHQNRIDTIIGRFHTNKAKYGKTEFTDTARSKYGNSHGRNLLKLDVNNQDNDTNGYENPYCRTWTYHHQYNQIKKMIRPFTYRVGDEDIAYKNSEIQEINKKFRAYRSDGEGNAIYGYQSLADNTVLQSNGFVKITPKKGESGTDVRKCMFSIENLAWKDVTRTQIDDNISKEQRGPNGGRIMWFPPYDLDFQESVNVEWNQNTFIGRGEKVYTYTNTERTGTLSFSLLIDHPAVINSAVRREKGNGSDNDKEADILRFFAGCGLFEDSTKDEPIEQPVAKKEEKPKEIETKEFKFKIYYPNNFSGIISDSRDCKRKQGIKYNSFEGFVEQYDAAFTEDYWWQYLLVGNDTVIPSDSADCRGYEMLNGTGLTSEQYQQKSLPTCQGNQYVVCQNPKKVKQDKYGFNNTCKLGTSTDGNRYYYQVDEDLHQQLSNNDSYKDTTSFQLNANFDYIDKKNKHKENEYTFAQIIMALLLCNKGKGKYGDLYDEYATHVYGAIGKEEETARIKSLSALLTSESIKFTSISYTGSADNNDKTNSSLLANRRAYTGYQMLSRLFDKFSAAKLLSVEPKIETGGKTNVPVNNVEQKMSRFCEFTITYTIGSEDLKNSEINRVGNALDIQQKRPETQENRATRQKTNAATMVHGVDNTIKNVRYETEGEYFENLEIEHPLIFKSLTDKFQYFNPAYHSISPEGFNARLTFLQQCTRQGQTCELGSKSNTNNGYTGTAANLAFGRMPVCVIRIGDFINTKAIINSMTISYAASDGVVWDLNAEGAGVQPMYAKISLSITLLGGQSLAAPISRLQNAISFNYYANTEAYDNRADVAEYQTDEHGVSTGKVIYKRIWTPLENDTNVSTASKDTEQETTQVVNSTKDSVNNEDRTNVTQKQPTDEEIENTLGSETIVESPFISYAAKENEKIKAEIRKYFVYSSFTFTIWVNEGYEKTAPNYDKTRFKPVAKNEPCFIQYNGEFINDLTIPFGDAIKKFFNTVYSFVNDFVKNH